MSTTTFASQRPTNKQHAAARHLAQPPALSESAQRRDKLDSDQFEKQAAELARPTLARPALITTPEIESIRTGYATGSGRLNVLATVTGKRLDWWTRENGGGEPFDPISAADSAKCKDFFQKNGSRLADQPKVAPPNPVRQAAVAPRPGDAALLAGSQVKLAPPAQLPTPQTASVATSPTPSDNKALDMEITKAEAKGTPPAPSPATLRIEFVSEQGFKCELLLHAASGSAALDVGMVAMKKLVDQKASAPVYTAAAQALIAGKSDAGQSASGEPPKCKYHGAMKPSKKPGTWYCPKKLATGEYCDQKAGE